MTPTTDTPRRAEQRARAATTGCTPRDPALSGTAVVLAASLAPLLRRMRRDFEADGRFRTGTAAAMWTAYAAGTAAFADAVRGHQVTSATAAAAAVPAAVGVTLLAAGMRAFDDLQQVTGTQAGPLVTGGVYRYSRNPQYTGIVLVAAAAAAATRSPRAAALAGVLAGVYRWWVPVEERALTREFGEPYREYLSTTPRWLGRARGCDLPGSRGSVSG